MKLLHGANHVSHMLDHVNGTNFPERIVGKRKREVIQVRDCVGICVDISVNADRPGMFFYAATDIENGKRQTIPANIS